jgi:hypothetical protein
MKELLESRVTLATSAFAVIALGLWWYFDPSSESRATFAIAVFTIIGLVFLRVYPIPRHVSPEQVIKLRRKWAKPFDDYFARKAKEGHRTDCIVHDVARMRDYDDFNDEDPKDHRPSSWFRAGLMGTYNHGVLIGFGWTLIEEIDGKWQENEVLATERAIKVHRIGEVPYETIEHVKFDGDRSYSKPHLFLHYDYNGMPCERFWWGREYQLDEGQPYHFEKIAEYSIRWPKSTLVQRLRNLI